MLRFEPRHVSSSCHTETICRSGNKTELFSDLTGFPVLQERTKQIQSVLSEIQEHLKDIRRVLKAPALNYTAVSGQEVSHVCVSGRRRERWEETDDHLGVRLSRRDDSIFLCVCVCVCVPVLIKSDILFCLTVMIGFFKVPLLSVLIFPQFLIEVKNSLSSTVPSDWVKISRWKHTNTHVTHLTFEKNCLTLYSDQHVIQSLSLRYGFDHYFNLAQNRWSVWKCCKYIFTHTYRFCICSVLKTDFYHSSQMSISALQFWCFLRNQTVMDLWSPLRSSLKTYIVP